MYIAVVEKVVVFVVLNYVFLPEMVFPLELESRHNIAQLSYQIIAHLKIILITLVSLKAVNAPLALMYIGRPVLYHRLLYSRVACVHGEQFAPHSPLRMTAEIRSTGYLQFTNAFSGIFN